MDQAQAPLLIHGFTLPGEAEQSKSIRARANWIICTTLLFSVCALSCWWLHAAGLDSWQSDADLGNLPMVIFHGVVALLATLVLAHHYLDPVPMSVKYRVAGDTKMVPAEYDFVHWGRWTTFTTWCNTLGAVYFWLVAAVCMMKFRDPTAEMPRMLGLVMGVLWDITCPMSFLVSLIVSFVLLPAKKKAGDFVGLWYMLQWRGQALHNAYVLVAALEAVLVSPRIPLSGFPVIVLYGCTYVFFGYYLYAKTGVFHYFFMDPRWKLAPVALVGLLVLLTGLYCAGSVFVGAAADSWFAKLLFLAAALATCTFQDRAAVAPSNAGGGVVA